MSQVLSMDRSWRYQGYGEQGNIIVYLFFSGSHLLILCFFSYPGQRITLVRSFFPPLFHPERRLLTCTYLNQVETRSCLPSRLNTSRRRRILRNRWYSNETFILKLGPRRYVTFPPPLIVLRSFFFFFFLCTTYLFFFSLFLFSLFFQISCFLNVLRKITVSYVSVFD